MAEITIRLAGILAMWQSNEVMGFEQFLEATRYAGGFSAVATRPGGPRTLVFGLEDSVFKPLPRLFAGCSRIEYNEIPDGVIVPDCRFVDGKAREIVGDIWGGWISHSGELITEHSVITTVQNINEAIISLLWQGEQAVATLEGGYMMLWEQKKEDKEE